MTAKSALLSYESNQADLEQWLPPDIDDATLKFTVGDSILAEFVFGHDHSAILRELVQNEYDAGGYSMQVYFRANSLHVMGTGRSIDTPGWRRLSVMLGTGWVHGRDQRIEPKENGIGIKNLGLRSLFLYGDRIHIRSNGRQTVLDRLKGTPSVPMKDDLTAGKLGIRIDVPYRTSRSERFEPFGKDQEGQALNGFAKDLTPTLMKLAQPNARRSLRELLVISERYSRQISWRQKVEVVPCRNRSVGAIRRQIRVSDSQQEAGSTLEEIEWQKVVVLPDQYRSQAIPGYFKVSQNKIRLGLSLRTKRSKIDLSEPGTFFYPLGVPRGYTGNAVSINAPFEMDVDRTRIIDPESSRWNTWLLDNAIDLTFELLLTDWFRRFGPNAYLMLEEVTKPSNPYYFNGITSRLGEDNCWPTRARQSGSKSHPHFVQAEQIVVPATGHLDRFLSSNKVYLDDSIGFHPRIQEMVKRYGAKSFGINSLVRLRCAGKNAELLATKPQNTEANYYYTDFPERLKDLQLQAQYSKALDANPQQLSSKHRHDLTNSRTTLTAAGGLEAPTNLWAVEEMFLSVCDVPESDRLHPSLNGSKVIRGLCKKFNPERWAGEVAQRIKEGEAREEERSALYQYILSKRGQFGNKLQALLRRTPVLRDHKGEWVAPSSITLRRVKGAKELKAALHFPNRDYERDVQLAQSLRFKDKVTSDDIVAFAEMSVDRPEMLKGLDSVLYKFRHLLTNTVIEKLKGISFLPSSLSGQDYPENLYISNPLNRACLGEYAPYVVGIHSSLYAKLGCKEKPDAADIVSYLEDLKQRGAAPPNPQVLYPALVEALGRERKPRGYYDDKPILWTGSQYSCPKETLIGARHRRVFLQSVPQVAGFFPIVQAAYLTLGAQRYPIPYHWQQLFLWFNRKYSTTGGSVTGHEKYALREAYSSLSELPPDTLPSIVSTYTKCLLDRKGRLHSQSDTQLGRFIVDDDPVLAGIIDQSGIQLAFADTAGKGSLRFYSNLGIKTLSQIRKRSGHTIGEKRQPSNNFKISEMLDKLHSPAFISVLDSLASHMFRKHTGVSIASRAEAIKKIQNIDDIYFVEHLEINYQVASAKVSVPANAVIEDDKLILSRVRSNSGLHGLLAQAFAELFVQDLEDQHNFADALFRLLACENPRSMKEYLRSRGISWDPASMQDEEETPADADELEDDEAQQTRELIRDLLSDSLSEERKGDRRPSTPQAEDEESEPEDFDEQDADDSSEHWTLPPIESVTVQVVDPSEDWTPPHTRPGGGGGGGWRPSGSREHERDTEHGQRGEEIIYLNEVARVKELGYPESRVVWASKDDPGCDYDILSVDEDGEDLWIEVKSTTTRDGRFQWSKAEFQKALQKGERYVLYRVYEVNTESPTIKCFRNPMALLAQGAMRIDIRSISAEIEPLSTA